MVEMHEQAAKKLVLHLKAAGEKFDDEAYVIHEIILALNVAYQEGWDNRRENERV